MASLTSPPQTTNQASGLYGSSMDLGFFEQWCQVGSNNRVLCNIFKDAFGEAFTHEMLEKNIAASNIE